MIHLKSSRTVWFFVVILYDILLDIVVFVSYFPVRRTVDKFRTKEVEPLLSTTNGDMTIMERDTEGRGGGEKGRNGCNSEREIYVLL